MIRPTAGSVGCFQHKKRIATGASVLAMTGFGSLKRKVVGNMENMGNVSIPQMMECIASEICEKYCKFPDQYITDNELLADLMIEQLASDHCAQCPLTQFFL